MAAKMLDTLKQEITCPLCLDIFKHPKKLPCDHIYCQECLRGLASAKKRADGSINCPECRAPAQVSSEDCSNFYTPFHINRLVEMYENGVRQAEDESAAVSRVSEDVDRGDITTVKTCHAHRVQTLSLYCETCEKLVCRDCIMFSCAKLQHTYGYVEDVLEKHKSDLSTSLFTVKDLQERMKGTLDLTGEFARNIDKEEAKVVREVDAAFAQLFDILMDEKNVLTVKLTSKFKDARTRNSIKRDEVTAVCAKLEKVMSSGNRSRKESGASFFAELKAKKAAIEEVIQAALAVEHPDPVELPDTRFSVIKPDKMRELCKNSIFTSDEQGVLKCHFEGGIEWNNVPLEAPSFVPMYVDTETYSIRKLKAHLYCLYTKKTYPVQVKAVNNIHHILAIRPQTRGRHELHVKHDGSHVSASPLQLYVTVKAHKKPFTLGQFNQPMGIKCAGEYVYVSELQYGLTILESRTLVRVSTIPLPDVWEVHVDLESKRLYGTDFWHHAVNMMTMDGKILRVVETRQPNGIRCYRNEIFVCCTASRSIQVYDKNLHYKHSIESYAFSSPDDLDFDEEGNLYVANQSSHTIAVLTPQGILLHTIGKPGTGPGMLNGPISVAVRNKLVYVTDNGNGRISVFTTAGEFVTVFGVGVLEKPECIAVDRDGYVYVTDNRSKVVVF